VIIIGKRLRQLREEKGFSQGDLEELTGLLTCYISRVENGHTVPSLETLEKFASALNVQLFELFYVGEGPAPGSSAAPSQAPEEPDPGDIKADSEARFLLRLRGLVGRIPDKDRDILLYVAKRLATR
jgi:transcriptional regulator with XRE-family HTH domain